MSQKYALMMNQCSFSTFSYFWLLMFMRLLKTNVSLKLSAPMQLNIIMLNSASLSLLPSAWVLRLCSMYFLTELQKKFFGYLTDFRINFLSWCFIATCFQHMFSLFSKTRVSVSFLIARREHFRNWLMFTWDLRCLMKSCNQITFFWHLIIKWYKFATRTHKGVTLCCKYEINCGKSIF